MFRLFIFISVIDGECTVLAKNHQFTKNYEELWHPHPTLHMCTECLNVSGEPNKVHRGDENWADLKGVSISQWITGGK